MGEMKITIEAITYPDGFENALHKELKNYYPFRVVIDSDHAGFVEFGTSGASGAPSSVRKSAGNGSASRSPVYENIKEWVEARRASSSLRWDDGTKSTEELAYLIYRKVMTEGIPPQPFLRPALFEMQRRLESHFYEEGTDMNELAEDLMNLMKRYLDENDTVYPGGSIIDSIHVEPISPDEVNEDSDGAVMLNGVPVDDSVMKSPYADLHGDETRAIERKNRLKGRF